LGSMITRTGRLRPVRTPRFRPGVAEVATEAQSDVGQATGLVPKVTGRWPLLAAFMSPRIRFASNGTN
jgi:hypothetical protein